VPACFLGSAGREEATVIFSCMISLVSAIAGLAAKPSFLLAFKSYCDTKVYQTKR